MFVVVTSIVEDKQPCRKMLISTFSHISVLMPSACPFVFPLSCGVLLSRPLYLPLFLIAVLLSCGGQHFANDFLAALISRGLVL